MNINISFPDKTTAAIQPAGKLKIFSNTLLENSFLKILYEMFIKHSEKPDDGDQDNILMNVSVKDFGLATAPKEDDRVSWNAKGS